MTWGMQARYAGSWMVWIAIRSWTYGSWTSRGKYFVQLIASELWVPSALSFWVQNPQWYVSQCPKAIPMWSSVDVGWCWIQARQNPALPPEEWEMCPQTSLSHTIFHTQLCHTLSFTHNFCHTLSFAHNFVTHHLSQAQLCHTPLCHTRTTLSHTHTTLSHTISHTQLCHTPSFTHSFVTHLLSHTQLCHTPCLTHNFVTHLLFAWQAWQFAWQVVLAHIYILFAWRAWHLGHAAALCVAGMAHGDIHLRFAWRVWRFVTFFLEGVALMALGWFRAWSSLVALGDIDVPFAWQVWDMATATFVLRGRRGTCGTGMALVARLVAVSRPGRRRTLRGTCWHRRSICVAGVALALGWLWWCACSAWVAWGAAELCVHLRQNTITTSSLHHRVLLWSHWPNVERGRWSRNSTG